MGLVEKGTLVTGGVMYPHSPEPSLRSGDEIRQSIFSVGLGFHSIPSIFSSPGMSIIAVNLITHTALEPPALSLGSFDLHGVGGLWMLSWIGAVNWGWGPACTVAAAGRPVGAIFRWG